MVLRMGNEAGKLSTRAFSFSHHGARDEREESSQAAYGGPENHPSNTALWCPLPSWSQQVRVPLRN